jgi:hypothetical protein
MRRKSLKRKSLRRKSLRRKSLRKKSLKRKNLRRKSLRNNDNGKDKEIELIPLQKNLNLDDNIFKAVWNDENIKKKYCNNFEEAMLNEPFLDKYSDAKFNDLLTLSIKDNKKQEYLTSVREYFKQPRNNLLNDINNIAKKKMYLYKDKDDDFINLLISELKKS